MEKEERGGEGAKGGFHRNELKQNKPKGIQTERMRLRVGAQLKHETYN